MSDNEQKDQARSGQRLSRVETKRTHDDAADGKNERSSEKKEKPPKSSGRAGRWVFRLVGIPLLILLFLYGGMVAGFVLLGKAPLSEALDLQTWMHIVKLIFE